MAAKFAIAAVAALALAGCSGTGGLEPLLSSADALKETNTAKLETVEGRKMIGKPYKVGGRWYKPKEDKSYNKVGKASWYGPKFHGRRTANGEIFDQNKLTAAHPTLPLPSYVRVTNKTNGKAVVLRLNDRGPFTRSRIIDVSMRAAEELDFVRAGHAKVRVEYLGPAPQKGGDRETLAAAKKFGTKSRNGSGPLRRLIPSFGGRDDEGAGNVEVRVASAEPAKTERPAKRKRPIPGIPEPDPLFTEPEPTAVAARTGSDESVTASAYQSEAPREEEAFTPLLQMAAAQDAPVSVSPAVVAEAAEPVPQEVVEQSGARVGGAFAMFDKAQ